MVTVFLLLAAVVACGGDDDDDGLAGEDEREAAEATTTTVITPSTPVPVPASECRAADESDVNAITLWMASVNGRLGEARTATDGMYRYVAGNIYEPEGPRLPIPGVWVFDGEVVYALSDEARTNSRGLADGRTLGLAQGDPTPVALQGCVIAATP